MKVGRNDPCPCGSGKKYKHCCLAVETAPPETGADLMWRRARRALDGHPARMLHFVLDAYGDDVLDEAWEEFAGDEEGFHPDNPHLQVFMPWFYHCWSPAPDSTGVPDASLHGVIPTTAFLERKRRHIDATLRRYLESCINEPFSFLEILRSDPGKGFRARDVITGEECEVLERSASETMREGHIVFAQLARIEGIVMLEACPLLVIPYISKVEVIKLRARIKAGSALSGKELLRQWDYELRDLYLKLTGELLDRPLPKFRNTDGDDLLLQRLIFEIASPQAAFDALKHLARGATDDDLLAQAERDPQGRLLRVRFDWTKEGNRLHKSWENTILGGIEVDGQRLIAHVNSAERAARFRSIVDAALGERARYRAAEIQSVEKMMADRQSGDRGGALDAETAALQELPEVKAQVAAMMTKHFEHWVTEPIPALGGMTPLDAVKNPDGREMVEVLIAQIERNSGSPGSPVDATIVATLRERLGLTNAAAKD